MQKLNIMTCESVDFPAREAAGKAAESGPYASPQKLGFLRERRIAAKSHRRRTSAAMSAEMSRDQPSSVLKQTTICGLDARRGDPPPFCRCWRSQRRPLETPGPDGLNRQLPNRNNDRRMGRSMASNSSYALPYPLSRSS
jgi:hypothetical protein